MEEAKIYCVRVRVYSHERVDVGGGCRETIRREHFTAERTITTLTPERAVAIVCNLVYNAISSKCRVELESCTEVEV